MDSNFILMKKLIWVVQLDYMNNINMIIFIKRCIYRSVYNDGKSMAIGGY